MIVGHEWQIGAIDGLAGARIEEVLDFGIQVAIAGLHQEVLRDQPVGLQLDAGDGCAGGVEDGLKALRAEHGALQVRVIVVEQRRIQADPPVSQVALDADLECIRLFLVVRSGQGTHVLADVEAAAAEALGPGTIEHGFVAHGILQAHPGREVAPVLLAAEVGWAITRIH